MLWSLKLERQACFGMCSGTHNQLQGNLKSLCLRKALLLDETLKELSACCDLKNQVVPIP